MTVVDSADILLAACNAGPFLAPQLQSIRAQTIPAWRILVRDAASSDGTVEFLQSCACADARISYLGSAAASARENFSRLLADSRADRVLFCDQDDVWFPHKLERLLAEIDALERETGPGVPLLVFSDSRVTDENLHVLDSSFFHRQRLNPDHLSFRNALFQNFAPGNTMIFNAALREKVFPVPAEADMHDHWLLLTALAFGRVRVLREPLLDYRQHNSNARGALPGSGARRLAGLVCEGPAALHGKIERMTVQAAAFLDRFSGVLSPGMRSLLEEAARLRSAGFTEKRLILARNGFRKEGLLRTLGFYAFV